MSELFGQSNPLSHIHIMAMRPVRSNSLVDRLSITSVDNVGTDEPLRSIRPDSHGRYPREPSANAKFEYLPSSRGVAGGLLAATLTHLSYGE